MTKISHSTIFSRVFFLVTNILFLLFIVFMNATFSNSESLSNGFIGVMAVLLGLSFLNILIHVLDFDVYVSTTRVDVKRMGILHGEYVRDQVRIEHYGALTKIFCIYKVTITDQRNKTFLFRNLMYRQTLFFKDLDYVARQIANP